MQRNFFQRIPFIRITSLFLSGLIASHYFTLDSRLSGVILVVLFAVLIFFRRGGSYSSTLIQNVLLSSAIFFTGAFYFGALNSKKVQDVTQKSYFLARVCQKPAEKAQTFQTVLLLQNKELTSPFEVVAYFGKNKFDSTLTTGNQLIILGKLQQIQNRGNPYEFDYQSMMRHRNIWYSVYLAEGTYLKTGKKFIDIDNWAEKFRDCLVEKLAGALPDKEERSVVSALTLGYRTELDQETLDYFASTGAMHVLSVSGLHVALLYMILGFMFGFIKRGKIGAILFPSVMILVLWAYAFISGFSPPVQRATVMFTFVVVGDSIRRPVNIYNSLTASALFLILLDPNVIFDVGFQLSYLAIFGIVLIQPALYNIIDLKNKSLQWLWALFTVSIAAQLVTFPLGVFYFNQFPNFFWLSNFVVVPITTFIMWAALVFFILTPVHALAQWAGIIIQKLTWFMLLVLKALDAHPLAVTRGLVFSIVQVLLVFGVIFSLVIFFSTRRKIWLVTSLVLLIGFQLDSLFRNYKLLNQRFLLVYNSKSTLIHLVNGRNNYLIVNEDKMWEADKKMIQKVLDYHKLNSPVLISRLKPDQFKSSDLCFTAGSVQFLNCSIRFNKKLLSGKTDELSIVVNHKRHERNDTQALISTGYPRKGTAQEAVFYTKTNGAYWLDIR